MRGAAHSPVPISHVSFPDGDIFRRQNPENYGNAFMLIEKQTDGEEGNSIKK